MIERITRDGIIYLLGAAVCAVAWYAYSGDKEWMIGEVNEAKAEAKAAKAKAEQVDSLRPEIRFIQQAVRSIGEKLNAELPDDPQDTDSGGCMHTVTHPSNYTVTVTTDESMQPCSDAKIFPVATDSGCSYLLVISPADEWTAEKTEASEDCETPTVVRE